MPTCARKARGTSKNKKNQKFHFIKTQAGQKQFEISFKPKQDEQLRTKNISSFVSNKEFPLPITAT
jgi:hypothetical protein